MSKFKLVTFLLLLVFASLLSAAPSSQKYNALFSFGDSMTETGNICVEKNSTELEVLTCTHPPYGVTYFGRPTCRWSDGRIVLDFIAQALELPLLLPSKAAEGNRSDLRRGVNMAITGATAMNSSFFEALGVGNPIWNHGPLDTQIRWFRDLMPSICGTTQECKGFLEKSLFVFGAFGGNDYNAQLFFGIPVEQAMSSTPKIANAIADGVEKLIALGAVHIVVPGILPTGCFPIYLTIFADSSNNSDFDQYGCLKDYNRLSEYHNALLQKALRNIQSKHRSTSIMYADYYNQMYELVQHPQRFGITFLPKALH